MDVRKLATDISVTSQITTDDINEASRLGFGTIICNRPDGEAENQPATAQIEKAARNAGLDFVAIPFAPGTATEAEVAKFCAVLDATDLPVLAYCRTGTRSATLWALASAETMSVNTILSTTASAGYDLENLRGRLGELAARKAD